MHDSFEAMKVDQLKLNEDLDYIRTQQNELEEMMQPLEEALKRQVTQHNLHSIHTHHADLEREKTYVLLLYFKHSGIEIFEFRC